MKSRIRFAWPALVLSLFAISRPGISNAADPPNLLIVQTDEHHFNTLGCYGGTVVETPNIDWLAKNGALCTSFYATHARLLAVARVVRVRQVSPVHVGSHQQYPHG